MTDQEIFTTRLRRHRERTRTTLADIARATRVKVELLEGLEQNDLSAWPRGLYARSYIRATPPPSASMATMRSTNSAGCSRTGIVASSR
jgi:hypothetical protein